MVRDPIFSENFITSVNTLTHAPEMALRSVFASVMLARLLWGENYINIKREL